MSELKGKVAIVTGAGKPRGIGQAAAHRLAAAGAIVVVTDLVNASSDQAALDNVVGSITRRGHSAVGINVDVTRRSNIDACVNETLSRFARIDILFNNAGTPVGCGPFLELTEQQWAISLDVNVKGMANFCQAVIPHMRERGGSIINTASLSGLGAVPQMAAYTATKFAVVGLTKAIASEFGGDGIRCNAICPGMVDTQMGDFEVAHFRKPGQTLDEARAALAADVPLMQRWAQPEEVAEAVVFLAGPLSGYVTGVALPIAGGLVPGL